MVSAFGSDRTVLQIVHGDYDYYYDLARAHEPVIDGFVACSKRVQERLKELLPHRVDHIFHLPYGIPIPATTRTSSRGSLRVVFVGRLDVAKGVLDIPSIDAVLKERGVRVRWSFVGQGPAGGRLRESLENAENVRWHGQVDGDEVFEILQDQDVLLLPSRAEGLPLSVVEAMAAGLVPVVSDLASGIPELVEDGRNGYRIPVGDIDGFAKALIELDADWGRLEELSSAARQHVAARFGARESVLGYERLFRKWKELYREKPRVSISRYLSRLDRPWIPNAAVKAYRFARRFLARASSAPTPAGPARRSHTQESMSDPRVP